MMVQSLLEKSKPYLRPIVNPLRFQIHRALAQPYFRKWLTKNYSSGLVAFGEMNGTGVPGEWITVDIRASDITMDLRKGSNSVLAPNSQQVVYSAHMVEHLDEKTLENLFREAYRILKPGGYIRLEAPDAEKIVSAYVNNQPGFFEGFQKSNFQLHTKFGYPANLGEKHITFIGLLSCYLDEGGRHIPVVASREEVDSKVKSLDLESFVQWCVSLQTPAQYQTCGHVTGIYYSKLDRMLKQAGFSSPERMRSHETSIPGVSLQRIERKHREFYSIFLEAKKPCS